MLDFDGFVASVLKENGDLRNKLDKVIEERDNTQKMLALVLKTTGPVMVSDLTKMAMKYEGDIVLSKDIMFATKIEYKGE